MGGACCKTKNENKYRTSNNFAEKIERSPNATISCAQNRTQSPIKENNSAYERPKPSSSLSNCNTNAPRHQSVVAIQGNEVDGPERSDLGDDFLDAINMFAQLLENFKKQILRRKGVHENITCDSCSKRAFKGPRYKCLRCADFDLCGLCFEKRRKAKDHLPSHAMLLIEEPSSQNYEALVKAGMDRVNKKAVEKGITHKSCICNGCDKEAFSGLRYKCDECLDLDLCFTCYSQSKEPADHKKSHVMVCWIYELLYTVEPSEIKLGEVLGEGCFGKTYKAIYKNKEIACKIVNANMLEILGIKKEGVSAAALKNQVLSLNNETKIYRELVSPSIIRYIGECTKITFGQNLDFNIQMMILLEYMNMGTLEDLLKNKKNELSLRRKFNLCLNLISGIRRIHSKGITHKDLKPDNIFIDEDLDLKIGDMGLAYSENSKHLEGVQQTYYYPQVRDGVQMPDDIYSFGFIMNEIFTGIKHKVLQLPGMNIKMVLGNSSFFKEIINACLQRERRKRATAEEIEDYLLAFDKVFWTIIHKTKTRYVKSMSQEDKDAVFCEFYPRIVEHLPFKYAGASQNSD